jgi:D-lactate dehydrogenase (cytochrome)
MIHKTDPDNINTYLTDASNYKGHAEEVFLPETIDELKEVIFNCYSQKLQFTISGSGTGLTGGRVPQKGAVISTERLNKIIDIDYKRQVAIVQPGVLLKDLDDELNSNGFFYPPNPTENLSSIGGNVANNSSGSRTFKYGATRKFVDSMELILPDTEELILKKGKCFSNKSNLMLKSKNGKEYSIDLPDFDLPKVKHSAGYYITRNMDVIDLFIGSEGTLGVYKEIGLSFIEKPENIISAVIYFQDDNNAINFAENIRDISIVNNQIDYKVQLGISARVLEYFDNYSLNLLRKKYSQIPVTATSAIWIEQEYISNNENTILNKWYALIKKHTALFNATWFAINDQEHEKMREFRHTLPLEVNEILVNRKLVKLAIDAAVPDKYLSEYYSFLIEIFNKNNIENTIYGHIGNNHLHANLFIKEEAEIELATMIVNKCLIKAVQMGGTVSAEHGIGKIKREYLEILYDKKIIDGMKRIKNVIDPFNLLNTGNIFI